MKQSELNELAQIVKEFSKDEFIVAAIPGEIYNNGKPVRVIKTSVGHVPSQKMRTFIYRDDWKDYRKTLKIAVDEIIQEIHAELVAGKDKPKNSL